MKKIIATVLAMVMALALCVTAFAAPTTAKKAYDNKGNELPGTYEYELVKAVSDKKVDGGSIKHYVVNGTAYYVAADASSYDLKLTSDGKAPLYLSEIDVYEYDYKATEFKAIGEKCGQLDLDEGVKGYVVETVAGKTLYFEGDESGHVALLVNGEIVMATAATPVEHTWKASAFDKDGNATEYKCKTCGTVAKVYKTVEAAEKAGMTETTTTASGDLIGWNYKVPGAGTTSTTTNGSPKTFDAGIAMYAGMALMSVAGSAVVIGKKKEF